MKIGYRQHCAWERNPKSAQSLALAVATRSNQAAEQDGISIIQPQCMCR
ncbi:hypothetical protein CFBP498_48230 (plasmid) [Xanthomonas hortorum pv. vitians]|uniref:Uncharacterized protein n=1 Tax=Xanthomonas hortorum pv. vitians TaxID=83224 RepID=A0A6V7FHJ2_9XANT|nr:hypothetical protein CFBP498_48230 [Xanthomonas hortorum pv. vitians]CAD0363132.1 hypothetical protein CFBP498_48230 [Xanthomonas hortorum pv. vitians]